MNTDPIADFLTRIRNGIQAGHDAVVIPASKIKERIAGILKQEGYIHSCKPVNHEGRDYLIINLKYVKDKQNVIHGLRRTGGKYGMVTMCVGAGQGAAGIIERL